MALWIVISRGLNLGAIDAIEVGASLVPRSEARCVKNMTLGKTKESYWRKYKIRAEFNSKSPSSRSKCIIQQDGFSNKCLITTRYFIITLPLLGVLTGMHVKRRSPEFSLRA